MNDFFARLGLPRRFSIDAAELERQYLARSRAAHPDFHVVGPAADLAASQEFSADLNQAYTSLRDPFARAEHLLALLGGPTAAEQKAMPAAFLMEMLEARERVEEVTAGNNACDSAKAELLSEFQSRYDELLADVAAEFAYPAPALATIREKLNAAKYVKGLIRDVDG
ncbi:MAG: Fe-S protein assembly co-chaperone HscB [Gemmataceae bacterium]